MDIRKATSRIIPTLVEEAGSVLARALDIALPPHSLITGLPIDSEDTRLWQSLQFLDAPCCDLCGYPFEYDQGAGSLCGPCHARPPKYDKGRSAILYDEHSRKIVLDFKHGGRTDGLEFFGAQMLRAGRELLARADMIVPVPLHKARLRTRRFNQSAVLARKLSQLSGLPYDTNSLQRRKNTPSQGAQSYKGRRRNMVGAFHVPATLKVSATFKVSGTHKPNVAGVKIVLVDDVLTSGATVEACAQVLKRAGATQVDILTLMRVVRPVSVAT